jgi:hypothetical protein
MSIKEIEEKIRAEYIYQDELHLKYVDYFGYFRSTPWGYLITVSQKRLDHLLKQLEITTQYLKEKQ